MHPGLHHQSPLCTCQFSQIPASSTTLAPPLLQPPPQLELEIIRQQQVSARCFTKLKYNHNNSRAAPCAMLAIPLALLTHWHVRRSRLRCCRSGAWQARTSSGRCESTKPNNLPLQHSPSLPCPCVTCPLLPSAARISFTSRCLRVRSMSSSVLKPKSSS